MSKLSKSELAKTGEMTTSILLASWWLKYGHVLAYPSESVWGMGCDAFCESALAKLLEIKQRPPDKGLIVLTDSPQRLLPLLEHLDASTKQLIMRRLATPQKKQAQTWLVPVQSDRLPATLLGTQQKLAVRITSHPALQGLCRNLRSRRNPFGFLVSTSCNPAGQPPAEHMYEAYEYFLKAVNYWFGCESLEFKKPSKITDILSNEVLRQ